jgi:hypothetical protein
MKRLEHRITLVQPFPACASVVPNRTADFGGDFFQTGS